MEKKLDKIISHLKSCTAALNKLGTSVEPLKIPKGDGNMFVFPEQREMYNPPVEVQTVEVRTGRIAEQSEARPWDGVAATGPILRPADAAAYLGISVPGYYEKAARGILPTPLKLGGRASGVPQPWLDAVIKHISSQESAQ